MLLFVHPLKILSVRILRVLLITSQILELWTLHLLSLLAMERAEPSLYFYWTLEFSLAQLVRRQLKSMLTSVTALLWLDLCVPLTKLCVEGLKDTIILPSLLYLVDRRLMLTSFAFENLSFQLTFPMLSNIIDNIRAASVPLHSDYPYQGVENVEV